MKKSLATGKLYGQALWEIPFHLREYVYSHHRTKQVIQWRRKLLVTDKAYLT